MSIEKEPPLEAPSQPEAKKPERDSMPEKLDKLINERWSDEDIWKQIEEFTSNEDNWKRIPILRNYFSVPEKRANFAEIKDFLQNQGSIKDLAEGSLKYDDPEEQRVTAEALTALGCVLERKFFNTGATLKELGTRIQTIPKQWQARLDAETGKDSGAAARVDFALKGMEIRGTLTDDFSQLLKDVSTNYEKDAPEKPELAATETQVLGEAETKVSGGDTQEPSVGQLLQQLVREANEPKSEPESPAQPKAKNPFWEDVINKKFNLVPEESRGDITDTEDIVPETVDGAGGQEKVEKSPDRWWLGITRHETEKSKRRKQWLTERLLSSTEDDAKSGGQREQIWKKIQSKITAPDEASRNSVFNRKLFEGGKEDVADRLEAMQKIAYQFNEGGLHAFDLNSMKTSELQALRLLGLAYLEAGYDQGKQKPFQDLSEGALRVVRMGEIIGMVAEGAMIKRKIQNGKLSDKQAELAHKRYSLYVENTDLPDEYRNSFQEIDRLASEYDRGVAAQEARRPVFDEAPEEAVEERHEPEVGNEEKERMQDRFMRQVIKAARVYTTYESWAEAAKIDENIIAQLADVARSKGYVESGQEPTEEELKKTWEWIVGKQT